MKKIFAAILAAATWPLCPPAAQAQNMDDIFRQVNPSVLVVRTRGRDVVAEGIVRFHETGSGVLISESGRVMTAAHVVNAMDEITVEGVGGEFVRAKLISSDAAADVSLLQLERLTAAMRAAKIGDSDTVRVGQQVMVIGAPYGGCPVQDERAPRRQGSRAHGHESVSGADSSGLGFEPRHELA